jgi:hypothetical protein
VVDVLEKKLGEVMTDVRNVESVCEVIYEKINDCFTDLKAKLNRKISGISGGVEDLHENVSATNTKQDLKIAAASDGSVVTRNATSTTRNFDYKI